MQYGQRGGLHEPVEPEAGDETDVVSAADVVDPCRCHLGEEFAGPLRSLLEQPGRREHADPCGHSRAACGVSYQKVSRPDCVRHAFDAMTARTGAAIG